MKAMPNNTSQPAGRLISRNPSQGDAVLGDVAVTGADDLAAAIERARVAAPKWRALGPVGRAACIRKLAAFCAQHQDELITRTSREMGMPLELSRSIVVGGLSGLEWKAENAPAILAPKILHDQDGMVCEQVCEPFGVVACIAAWNFPFGNFAGSAGAALMAGNTVVMKYSEEVPLFSQYLEQLINQSGALPAGVMQFVYGDGAVGAALVSGAVDFINFTGSSQTGRLVYRTAAEKMVPVILEMGGSSPGVVFEDAVLDEATIQSIFWKRFANTGQFCDGLKRLIVHESRFDECVEKLAAMAARVRVGDSLDPQTELGPLVAERQVRRLEGQLQDAIDQGAKIVAGGRRPPGLAGAYFEPTIVTQVKPSMKIWHEEVFGPLLPVVSFKDEAQAMATAHDTEYGLSAYVYTRDPARRRRVMDAFIAGSVDDGVATYWHPTSPFGGYRQSGIGRIGGAAGLIGFSQIKVMAYQKTISGAGA
jgi:succinate-semialdehyde dehydrogenase/glutarate-semialdehyde dehydrogenase